MACENCTCGKKEWEECESSSGEVDFNDPKNYQEALNRAKVAEEKLAKLLKSIEANKVQQNGSAGVKLRSREWFNNANDPAMTALYLERYLNYGITLPELTDDTKPIIGIAQTGSDLSPCNRHHLTLAKRVRDGIIAAGATPIEFPCHPIQETGKRPTASLDRNLAYLSLVEVLFGYPIDGVVLLTGCDKTTPALLMAASTVNIPAIVMNVGPMLNGYHNNKLSGSGTVIWDGRKDLAVGMIDYQEFLDLAASSAPSVGHCNTMGTASTMNAMAEALGMALPGSASIPAAYRERGQCAYNTGKRIVELVREDIRPADILTKEAFENAIAANTATGGSTNAPIHLNAIAKHVGVKLDNDDWERVGYEIPLLLNVQPAGEYLCEEYHRAGGLPSIMHELLLNGKLPHPDVLTVNGFSWRTNCIDKKAINENVIRTYGKPLKANGGFLNLKGSLFESAIMKTSVISEEFRERYLSNPKDPMAFEGPAVVFEGPEDYHSRIDSLSLTEKSILVIRGCGPVGYPGAAEVVNMQPPASLMSKGVRELPCIGDGRQSGTSGSPSILNASPESATGGALAYLENGDTIRIDLLKRSADILVSEIELNRRKATSTIPRFPPSQTPWQELYRKDVSELNEGMVLKSAVKYQRVAQLATPRHSH